MSTPDADTFERAASADYPLLALLRDYGREDWPTLGVGVAATALARVPDMLTAFVLGVALDAVFTESRPYSLPFVPDAWLPTGELSLLWLTVAIVLGAYLGEAALSLVSAVAFGRFSEQVVHRLRVDAYASAQELSVGYYEDRESGDVISVLNNDVTNVGTFLTGGWGGLSQLVRSGAAMVVVFGFLAAVNWQFAVLFFLAPVLIVGIGYALQDALGERYGALRESVGRLNNRLSSNVGGMGTIKAFATEDRERDRVADSSGDYRDASMATVRVRSLIEPSAWAVQNLAFSGLFLLGGYWILVGLPWPFTGSLTAGGLLTYLLYVDRLRPHATLLAQLINGYENSQASARRILGLLEEPVTVPEPDEPVDRGPVEGSLAVEDVTFAYGEREPAIQNVSLSIEPGEFVGVVGPTGAGKSTLLKLLLRFYDPDEGTVRLDGHDLRDLPAADRRSAVGYVSQEPYLFHGTVRENVAYGVESADDEAVREAAAMAGLDAFVRDLPEGYDTQVGERGVKLSGGQRQRLAIARAILRDPPVLLLDEATSHVDNETEALLQRNLGLATAGRTTVAVAHRLSTVRDADRIVVLSEGRVAETGTHEDLLAADGLYADLWRVQVGEVAEVSESFVRATARREGGR